jgi:hypothetical protein
MVEKSCIVMTGPDFSARQMFSWRNAPTMI